MSIVKFFRLLLASTSTAVDLPILLEYLHRSLRDGDAWAIISAKYMLSCNSVFHDLGDAIADVERAMAVKPDAPEYPEVHAEFLSMRLTERPIPSGPERKQIVERIRADYRKVLEIQPLSSAAWLGLIEAGLLSGDWDEAVGAYGASMPYMTSPEELMVRSLLGCTALALAGERIEEADEAPLRQTELPKTGDWKKDDERNRQFTESVLGPRVLRIRTFVLEPLRHAPDYEGRWRIASAVPDPLFGRFSVWPRYGAQHEFDLPRPLLRYERALVLRSVPYGQVFDLAALDEEQHEKYGDHFLKALNENDKVREANADDATAWYERALLLKGLRRPDALEALAKAIALDPDCTGVGGSARLVKAEWLAKLGRDQDAIEVLDELTRVDRADVALRAVASAKSAEVFLDMAEKQKALISLEHAITLQPAYADAWLQKAHVLRDLAQPEEALDACDRAISVRPYYAILVGIARRAWELKARVLQDDVKRHEDALEALDRVLELVDGDTESEILLWKGDALEALGRSDDALRAWDRALQKCKGLGQHLGWDADAWHRKAIVFTKLGLCDEALDAHAQAIGARNTMYVSGVKKNAEEWRQKGRLLERLGRHEEAQGAFESARQLVAEDAAQRYEQAVKGAREGRVTGWLVDAIELEPEYKSRARTDPAFKDLWEDPNFQRAVA